MKDCVGIDEIDGIGLVLLDKNSTSINLSCILTSYSMRCCVLVKVYDETTSNEI